jgi:bifunctional DNase/RNase
MLLESDELPGRVLPIWIGTSEALSIAAFIHNETLPRPFTHDLFVNTIAAFGVKVTGVEIDRYDDQVYFAKLHARNGGDEKVIDSRPSDAIAIALRSGAEITIDDAIMRDNSIDKAEIGVGVE